MRGWNVTDATRSKPDLQVQCRDCLWHGRWNERSAHMSATGHYVWSRADLHREACMTTCNVCGEVYEAERPDPDLAVCEPCWRAK